MQVKLSAVDYGRVAGQQAIADIDSVVFEQDSGKFIVPLYMTADEFVKYSQDQMLPKTYVIN